MAGVRRAAPSLPGQSLTVTQAIQPGEWLDGSSRHVSPPPRVTGGVHEDEVNAAGGAARVPDPVRAEGPGRR